MVGVAGQSKACNTCRSRKIGCSGEKPRCAQCVKSNRICLPNQKRHIFVESARDGLNPSAVKAQRAALQEQRGRDVPSGYKRGRPPKIESHVSSLTSTSACQQQLVGSFLAYYFPDDLLQPARQKPWLVVLADLNIQTSALQNAMHALVAIKLSDAHSDINLRMESLHLYNRALRDLQHALYDVKLMRDDEILAASLALCEYEKLSCSGDSRIGHTSHVDGCSKLLEARGPRSYNHPLGHSLFLAIRGQLAVRALEQHQPNFLACPPWMNEPWQGFPKSFYQRVLDVLVMLPTFFAEGRDIDCHNGLNTLNTLMKIRTNLLELDDSLTTVYKELNKRSLGPLFWPELSRGSITGEGQDKVYPTAFVFVNLDTAAVLTLYWAACALLWTTFQNTEILISSMSSDEESNVQASEEKSPSSLDCNPRNIPSMADSVCQSVEYCIRSEFLQVGPTMILVPLLIAMKIFQKHGQQHSRKLRFTYAALQKIRERGPRIFATLN